MKKNTKNLEYYVLFCIFIFALAFRLYFVFSSDSFDNDESYYVIRQVENIHLNSVPLYKDNLSYSGRENIFSPGYYYILYFFSFFIPEYFLFKILPNIFACLTVFLIYLIVNKLTNNIVVSLFSSFISIFIPVFLISTTNTISVYCITVPLILLLLWLFINLDNDRKHYFLIFYIISLLIYSFISASVFIFVFALALFMVFMEIEGVKITKLKKEVILFSIFSVLWFNLLIFKRAMLMHGTGTIWQNIPQELIKNYFTNINILIIIYYIGIIPFFFGLYVFYKYSFKSINEDISLIISLILITVFLLLFKLIRVNFGLSILGFFFVILFGIFYKQILIYIEKTKFSKTKWFLIVILLFLFFFTSILPSYALLISRETISTEKLEALYWIKNNTEKNAVILGTVNEGNLISSVAERKNIIDSNFLLINNINNRMEDIKTIYTTTLLVQAVDLLNYYGVTYVLIDDAKYIYKIKDLSYNDKCISLVYDNFNENNRIKIYKIMCEIEKIER